MNKLTIALCSASLLLAACATTSIDTTIHDLGYTPLPTGTGQFEPGQVVQETTPPGGMFSTPHFSANPICGREDYVGAAAPMRTASAATRAASQALGGKFDVTPNYKQRIDASIGADVHAKVLLTFTNVEVVEMDPATVITNRANQTPGCALAIDSRKTAGGRPLGVIELGLKADVVYTVDYGVGGNLTLNAKTDAAKTLSGQGNVSVNADGSVSVEGKGLYWGIATPSSADVESNRAIRVGFSPAGSREHELNQNCGSFIRVAGAGDFSNLCTAVGRTCQELCDFNGTKGLSCNGSNGDLTRVATCVRNP